MSKRAKPAGTSELGKDGPEGSESQKRADHVSARKLKKEERLANEREERQRMLESVVARIFPPEMKDALDALDKTIQVNAGGGGGEVGDIEGANRKTFRQHLARFVEVIGWKKKKRDS